MPDKNLNASGLVVGWLERVVALESKFGFLNIIKSLFLVVLTVCVALFTLHPTWFFERLQNYTKSIHDAAMEKRVQVDPLIRSELLSLASITHADRAWVIEFHNGTTSLGGLPFRFGDMTYEQPSKEVSLMDTNQNISLSRFQFITHLYAEGYWYGSLEELKQIDESFYYKMRSEGVNYLAILLLQGVKSPIGFLAVSFEDLEHVNEKLIGRSIRNSAMKLSGWLDNDRL